MASQKSIQFTVLNIRKKGWIFAPWFVPYSHFLSSLLRLWLKRVLALQEEASPERKDHTRRQQQGAV
jgi:hypothetical protein